METGLVTSNHIKSVLAAISLGLQTNGVKNTMNAIGIYCGSERSFLF
jgi:hypothetical protein